MITRTLARASVVLLLSLAPTGALPGQEPRVVERRITSRALGEDRVIEVHLPANYDIAKRSYPTLYLLDADNQSLWDLTVAASSFTMQLDAIDRAIPPHIVVGIIQKERGREFARGSASFASFIRDEVIPTVDREFRTSPFRIIVGHSLAGRFALETLCSNRIFAAAIAISPAITPSESAPLKTCLRERFQSDSGRLTQIVISSGMRAGDRTEEQFRPQHLELATFLADSVPHSLRFQFLALPDVSHSQTPFSSVPQGIWFIHDRSVWELPASTYDSAFSGKLDFTSAFLEFNRMLSARVGFAVPPDLKWLQIATFMTRGAREKVVAAQRAVDSYPDDLDARISLAEAQMADGDTVGARRVLADALALARKLAGSKQLREERIATVQKKLFTLR